MRRCRCPSSEVGREPDWEFGKSVAHVNRAQVCGSRGTQARNRVCLRNSTNSYVIVYRQHLTPYCGFLDLTPRGEHLTGAELVRKECTE